MNIFCDLLILAFFLLCVFLGYKRGFIKTFFGFFGKVIAFVLTAITAKPLAGYVSGHIFYPFLKEKFLADLTEKTGQTVASLDFSDLPEICQEILARFGTDTASLSEHLAKITVEGGESVAETASLWVVKPFADSLSYSVSFLALFLLFSIAIRILTKVLNLVSKVPGLNFSNRLLGIAAGVLEGLLLSVLISFVLSLAEPAIQGNENEWIRSFSLEQTHLVKLFAKFNVLGIL